MLVGAGIIAGRNLATRFAWFIYAFAIWDIFYYVFLKVLLGWPESLFTWDLLFLIPVTWTGPVLAPVIVSFTMIVLALLLVNLDSKNDIVKITAIEWALFILGSLMLIVSFTIDYVSFISNKTNLLKILSVPKELFINISLLYVPSKFYWSIFIIGELFIALGITRIGWNNNLFKT
jgi:hypothetical protein